MGPLYGQLFIDVFGHQYEHHVPDHVWLFAKEDESDIMGFAEGYEIKRNEIFLQFGGCRPEYRGFRVKKWLRQVRDYLHEDYIHIITSVENTNTPMLRLYLSIGYVIFGVKIATDKTVFVELISECNK